MLVKMSPDFHGKIFYIGFRGWRWWGTWEMVGQTGDEEGDGDVGGDGDVEGDGDGKADGDGEVIEMWGGRWRYEQPLVQ